MSVQAVPQPGVAHQSANGKMRHRSFALSVHLLVSQTGFPENPAKRKSILLFVHLVDDVAYKFLLKSWTSFPFGTMTVLGRLSY